MTLQGRQIILGVTGGIAAYKSADLASRLTQAGARVTVVMTDNAQLFVSPLTFRALTGRPVLTDMFDLPDDGSMPHIDLSGEADLLVIAPATANILAKLAHGTADDSLTTIALACPAPLMLAPAMNTRMWEHPATRENVQTLLNRGATILTPEKGRLACGTHGAGRMAEPGRILELVQFMLHPKKDLQGFCILVTAGPTREPIDPVRHITNRSSGKMGYAIAAEAAARGAKVTLVSGPTALTPPPKLDLVMVATTQEMADAVLSRSAKAHAVIAAGAPCDYRPVSPSAQKNEEIRRPALPPTGANY